MKIKKLGHSCFIIESKPGIRVMFDPGAFSQSQNEEKNISLILITHEHQDHLDVNSLKKILENNPEAIVITNSSVGKVLDSESIKYLLLEEGQKYDLHGVAIKAFGNLHAEAYPTIPQIKNTGYMVDGLCYSGDAFSYPDEHVDVLALPIAGPWMKLKETVDYAKNINPRIVFPVHDAFIHDWAIFFWKNPENLLSEVGILFKKLDLGKEEEL